MAHTDMCPAMLLNELAALDPSEMTGGYLAARGTHGGWDVLGEFADNDRKRPRIVTNTKRKPAKQAGFLFLFVTIKRKSGLPLPPT